MSAPRPSSTQIISKELSSVAQLKDSLIRTLGAAAWTSGEESDIKIIAFYKALYENREFKLFWNGIYSHLQSMSSTESLDFFIRYLQLIKAKTISQPDWKEFFYKWIDTGDKSSNPNFYSHQKINVPGTIRKKLVDLNKKIEEEKILEIDLEKINIDIEAQYGDIQTKSGSNLTKEIVAEALRMLSLDAYKAFNKVVTSESESGKVSKVEVKKKKEEKEAKKEKKHEKELEEKKEKKEKKRHFKH